MRIKSGSTDQVIYFVAVDATDLVSLETGLASFTVYRSRGGGSATVITTPTVTEVDATDMPGVYTLLLDEDMTISSGKGSEEMAFRITHAGMAPVTRTIELYQPANYGLPSAADVNAQVVDALATDTYVEPGQGTPAATLSLAAKINYLYKAWRNKSEQTADTYSLYNDAGDTVDQEAAVSDDGTTFLRGEVGTGA